MKDINMDDLKELDLKELINDEDLEGLMKEISQFTASPAQKSQNMLWLERCIERGKYELFAEFHIYTPEMAQYMLDKNPLNRNINNTNLRKMTGDLAQDLWIDNNGETIIISCEGLLNTGQHRSKAIIDTGRSIETCFAFGVSRESRKSTDTGFSKTAGNLLAMDEVLDCNVIAAFCSHYHQYTKRNRISHSGHHKPTKAQVLTLFKDNRSGIERSLNAIPRVGCGVVGGSSILTFCHFVFATKDLGEASFFIQKLVKGDNLDSEDPRTSAIFYCRNRLITDKKLRPEEKIELIFRAWNAFRTRLIVGRLPTMGNQLPDVL